MENQTIRIRMDSQLHSLVLKCQSCFTKLIYVLLNDYLDLFKQTLFACEFPRQQTGPALPLWLLRVF